MALHDLGVIADGGPVSWFLAVGPPLIWIAAVLWRRPPHPFATMVVIGAAYAVFLAVGHQLLWDAAVYVRTPALGGRLAGVDPRVQDLVLRVSAFVSSNRSRPRTAAAGAWAVSGRRRPADRRRYRRAG